MMKFTGLILICATSALALLLPALGMVKFPMVDVRSNSSAAIDPSVPPPGLPVAVPNLPGSSQPRSGLPGTAVSPTAASPTAGEPSLPSLLGPPWTTQKLSLNAWLLLGPVLLLGLVLWTFAPNRGGVGRRASSGD